MALTDVLFAALRLVALPVCPQPVIEYYRNRGVLASVNADQGFKKVYDDITKAMAKSK